MFLVCFVFCLEGPPLRGGNHKCKQNASIVPSPHTKWPREPQKTALQKRPRILAATSDSNAQPTEQRPDRGERGYRSLTTGKQGHRSLPRKRGERGERGYRSLPRKRRKRKRKKEGRMMEDFPDRMTHLRTGSQGQGRGPAAKQHGGWPTT